ncbi:MAG TPA: hypothetical protein PK719_07160, partial [Bacteroidales bacterium]|jgi:hypothetical protein|nr:hypothetical protein [Bacteroidales bacterium]NMD01834.1 hypothetical protein [Bacteroidales bacterium]OQB59697.1 MAG: hypothetical protein BWX96_02612 [Bacteroidetes bacterium ADurb.Bin145]HQG63420.1 hypothetical protein [Bacteroidales bacterium]HQK68330.1 hypothetical protein [Bacteroidales bacterium]
MSRKIQLSENHTRSLSSSLIVIEKSLVELEEILMRQSSSCCSELIKDVNDEIISGNISSIQEAKRYISELAEKYGTSKEKISLQRLINAKRAKIWEILTDILSKKSKGYGTFPKKYAEEYDADINKLIEITNKIIC